MALTKLSTCAMVERGYGQVEPNQLTASVDAGLVDQYPIIDPALVGEKIENGRFLKLGQFNGRFGLLLPGTTSTEATRTAQSVMVFNEVKNYDERLGWNDFVNDPETKIAEDGLTESLYVRCVTLRPSVDFFTTNTVNVAYDAVNEGNTLYVAPDGFISATGDANDHLFTVEKKYTMPDGQDGVMLRCIG